MVNFSRLILGGAAFGVCLLVYYLSDDGTGPSLSSKSLQRDQVLLILKDLKRELGGVYITISTFASSIKEQSGGRMPENALKEILITQTPIPSLITKAESKVYEQHEITEQEFKEAVERHIGSDLEIQQLIEEMKKSLELAYKGIMLEDNAPLPEFLTSEVTLRVIFEMFDSGKYITYKKLASLKARGIQPDPNSPEFMRAFQEMENEAETEKDSIYEKYGLAGHNESPVALLRKAQQKYSNSEPGFKQKIMTLEDEYNHSMALIMKNEFPKQEVQRLTKKYGQINN